MSIQVFVNYYKVWTNQPRIDTNATDINRLVSVPIGCIRVDLWLISMVASSANDLSNQFLDYFSVVYRRLLHPPIMLVDSAMVI
jgi:hypothetical protein